MLQLPVLLNRNTLSPITRFLAFDIYISLFLTAEVDINTGILIENSQYKKDLTRSILSEILQFFRSVFSLVKTNYLLLILNLRS